MKIRAEEVERKKKDYSLFPTVILGWETQITHTHVRFMQVVSRAHYTLIASLLGDKGESVYI